MVGRSVQAVALVLGVLGVVGFAALVLVEVYDPSTGQISNLLGHPLRPSAGAMGLEMSPGLVWEFVYGVVGIALLGLVSALWKWGGRLRATNPSPDRDG